MELNLVLTTHMVVSDNYICVTGSEETSQLIGLKNINGLG